MTTTIVTGPQSSIATYIPNGMGGRIRAIVDAKEYIVNRTRSGNWTSVNDITDFGSRISYDGFRGRLSELTAAGYVFDRRYNEVTGTLTSIRLVSFPVTNFHIVPTQ